MNNDPYVPPFKAGEKVRVPAMKGIPTEQKSLPGTILEQIWKSGYLKYKIEVTWADMTGKEHTSIIVLAPNKVQAAAIEPEEEKEN